MRGMVQEHHQVFPGTRQGRRAGSSLAEPGPDHICIYADIHIKVRSFLVTWWLNTQLDSCCKREAPGAAPDSTLGTTESEEEHGELLMQQENKSG